MHTYHCRLAEHSSVDISIKAPNPKRAAEIFVFVHTSNPRYCDVDDVVVSNPKTGKRWCFTVETEIRFTATRNE